MNGTTEITEITCRWDDQAGVTPGWYCESFRDGEMVDDSQKIWFPIDVDSFGQDDSCGLREALGEAFPNAVISFEA